MRQDLEQRFGIESKSLELFRERSRERAVRWQFSTVPFLSHDLAMPRTGGIFYACGYDETDRPIVVRHFSADLTPLIEQPGVNPEPYLNMTGRLFPKLWPRNP